MAQVKLNYDSTDYIVKCTDVEIGYNTNIEVKPNANAIFPVAAQWISIENPIYILRNVMLIEKSGHITKEILLEMARTPSASILLTIDYGEGTVKKWVSLDGSVTDIPVKIKPFNVKIPITDKHNNGTDTYYLPSFDLKLVETS